MLFLFMARSVVFRGTARCPQCQIAPRWCICAGARTVALPFAVDVLMHHGEAHKPTSTGNLIGRVVPASRRIIYHNQRLPRREDVCLEKEGRVTWILHPRGDALDEVMRDKRIAASLAPADLQVLLIDGTWTQANDMLRHVDGWGQKVSLPASALSGESRYWLRSQHQAGHFSTIEALMGLLKILGFTKEYDAVRLQFELHVYACLLARGQKAKAEKFIVNSPLNKELPHLVECLRMGGNADSNVCD